MLFHLRYVHQHGGFSAQDQIRFRLQVMLSSVVTHSPLSKVAPAALLELRTACDLFEKAASYGGRAVKFLVSSRFLICISFFSHVIFSRFSRDSSKRPIKLTLIHIAVFHLRYMAIYSRPTRKRRMSCPSLAARLTLSPRKRARSGHLEHLRKLPTPQSHLPNLRHSHNHLSRHPTTHPSPRLRRCIRVWWMSCMGSMGTLVLRSGMHTMSTTTSLRVRCWRMRNKCNSRRMPPNRAQPNSLRTAFPPSQGATTSKLRPRSRSRIQVRFTIIAIRLQASLVKVTPIPKVKPSLNNIRFRTHHTNCILSTKCTILHHRHRHRHH